MSKRGIRSEKARKRRAYISDNTRAISILHRYSWKDPINGELVFTPEGKTIVSWKLKENFGDGYPTFPLNHEYGEVLNRFKMNAPPLYTYAYGRGCFQ